MSSYQISGLFLVDLTKRYQHCFLQIGIGGSIFKTIVKVSRVWSQLTHIPR